MNSAYISAISALCGSAIGALASLATTWLTQCHQDETRQRAQETARRELLEEAGYLAADWHVLTDIFTSPGFSTERLRVFLARELTHVPEAERDYVPNHEEAHLEVEWAPLDVVVSRFLAGELHNGVTAVGALAAYVTSQGGFAGLRGTDAPEH